MKNQKRILQAVLLSLAGLLFPMFLHAENPIIQTKFTADPAPVVVGDTVFLYTSHDEDDAFGFKMKNWLLYKSTDMVNWTDCGMVASLYDFPWADKAITGWEGFENGAWAPQCIFHNGKYYLYCPVQGRGIGVLVSDSPYGPFKDPLGKPLIGGKFDSIDPTILIDDDGQAYLYWGNPNLWYVKLNKDLISFEGEPIKDASVAKVPGKSDPYHYQEGPWAYKRNGKYYMAYASTCCPEGIGYAMSDSPTGPWVYKNMIMDGDSRSSGNHPGIIDFKGNSYVFGFNYSLLKQTMQKHSERRSVCIEKLTYLSDGTIEKLPFWSVKGVEQLGTLNPFKRVEAETIANSCGLKTDKTTVWERDAPYNRGRKIMDKLFVTSINNGDFLCVKGVDFETGARSIDVHVASLYGGTIEVWADAPDGKLLATIRMTTTGAGDVWTTLNAPVKPISGIHNLYFKFYGKNDLCTFDWWQFNK